MELRVLRYFLTVAREESITGAADFLHITQPTLSRQLMDLEEELGKKLLIRGNRKITLTSEGRLLRKRAEEIIELVDKTADEFNSMEENLGGDIYVGGGETDAMKHLAKIAKNLQTDYPNIRYHLYSGNADDVMERLDKGLLDFGVLIEPVDVTKYRYINMPVKDVWGVIMRKDSPLSLKNSIKIEDLLSVPLLCSIQALKTKLDKNEFLEWFGNDFEKLKIVTTFNLIYNATLMVEEGIGYAIGLDKIANTGADSNLCFRPLEPKLESGLVIVWKKYQVFSKAAEKFLERVQQEFVAASKSSD